MRIAHLTTVDMSLALLLSTELAADIEAGHEVFGMSAPGPYVAAVESLGVRHVPIPALTRSWDLRRDATVVPQLWRAIREVRPDVLHTHNPKTGVFGRVLGRAARVPVVVNTCHGLWTGAGDGAVRRWAVLAIEGAAAQLSHAELFQNAEDLHALRWARLGAKATVVGNGIDLDRFRFDPDGRARVRADWGIGPDQVVVGGVGRVVAEKGIWELSEAARAIAGLATVVWVGPTDDAKADRITGPVPGVRLVGSRDDMPAVYSAFDVFVLPSHREGFSRSAMEAAACGRAMVLTDIRGCREVGTHDEHLLLVPRSDPVALADALASLAVDAARRRRLGSAAARRASEVFDQRVVAQVSLDTYGAVARRRGHPWT